MRVILLMGCMLSAAGIAAGNTCVHPQGAQAAKPGPPSVRAILREASDITSKQDIRTAFWSGNTLLVIGKMQMRAGDFDGALQSIRSSTYEYGRNMWLLELAKAVARDGKKDRALEIVRMRTRDEDYYKEFLRDVIQFPYVEHFVASGNLESAGKAIQEMKSDWLRPEALGKLAVAYAKSGDVTHAGKLFAQAVDVAARLKDGSSRDKALRDVAGMQISVSSVEAAPGTIRELTERLKIKDAWDKFIALKEFAVIAAKAKNEPVARRLFDLAINAQRSIGDDTKPSALEDICTAQAAAGFYSDTLKTALMLNLGEKGSSQGGKRDIALGTIAVAKYEVGDIAGAIDTATSITNYTSYLRDAALDTIVQRLIAKRDVKTALEAAGKLDNPSRRAATKLRVATAYAKSGDRKTAVDVAGGIQLTRKDNFVGGATPDHFDPGKPQSWGVTYDGGLSGTNRSRFDAAERAAEVGAAAMELFKALNLKPEKSFAVLFNDINQEQIPRSLARAHAKTGNADEALAWAKQIGSSEWDKSKDEFHNHWAIQRRIYALIGVAEGMLDRAGVPSSKEWP